MSAVRTTPAPAEPVLGPLRGERVEVTTPEGVPVAFEIAPAGDRAAALFVDLILIALAALVVSLLASLAAHGPGGEPGWFAAFASVALFLGWHLYFIGFELGRGGRTPGKKWLGIRVVDGSGGVLGAEAVIVRNLTRDLELLVPLAVMAQGAEAWPGAPGWIRLAALGWALLLALVPFSNRRRLRIGDLVAGTMVVKAPRARLLADLGDTTRKLPGAARVFAPVHAFTDAQLDVYGIYELQVLEDVLRRASDQGDSRALTVVRDRIQAKLGWPKEGRKAPPEPFLREFYAALRARLEARMLLGKRKADKHSG